VPELKFVVEEKRGAIDLFRMWLPRVALALAFVFVGYTKFDNDPHSEWVKIFEQIGFGRWFRYFTGAMQITGALLMLTPWTLTIGAAMLACTMVGAILVDIFVAHAAGFALLPLLLLGAIAATWFSGHFAATNAASSD